MCIRDRNNSIETTITYEDDVTVTIHLEIKTDDYPTETRWAVSYTHLRAHETVLDLVCRLLLEKKKKLIQQSTI